MRNPARLKNVFLLALFAGLVNFALATTDDPFWFNFAFNRTVTQSTTATDGEAEKAVDGIPSPGHCSKTDGTDIPYLVVDLGKEVFPTYIRLQLNREIELEVYPEVTLRFGNSPDYSLNEILRKFSTRSSYYDHTILNQRGRYVSMELAEAGVLSICEIFVFTLPFDQIGYGKPVEVSKRSNQLRNDDYGRKHELSNHRFAWTTYSDLTTNPWIRLDLEDSYFIRELDIFAHRSVRIYDFAIRIGDSLKDDGRANPSCAEHQNLDFSAGQAYFCRKKGRYVVITVDTVAKYQLQVHEMLVNPSNQKNYAESLVPLADPACQEVNSFCWTDRLTDNFLSGGGFISKAGSNGNWLRLDLEVTISVGKIMLGYDVPSEYKDQMIDFEIRVGDSLENNGNSNPLCLDGLQSMLGKNIASFYCESTVSGQYVNLNQKTTDKHLSLSEIAVYSDFEPKMKDRFSNGRQIWRSIGENIVLQSCAAYGRPTPSTSWMKDGKILKTNSDAIEVNSATVQDSGVYECWANNTHGAEYMLFHVNITSNIRPCADSLEIEVDMGNSEIFYPEIRGNKWYRFYDPKSYSYLKMVDKTPKKASKCNASISGSHPKPGDTVATRTVCVKEESSECIRQFEIRIRNCLGYYVYNLPWSYAVTKVGYCFEPDKDARPIPAIYMRGQANHALINHVLQVEMDVQDSTQCMILCNLKSTCQSFNYSDKKKVCQLNSSTKQKHPKDFKASDGNHYYMQGKGIVNKRFAGEM